MGKIQILDEKLVNLIAAGEVVERPASVVKELMENSLDAAATKIIVRVRQGGKEDIQIEDNGSGIEPDDLPLTLTQHATSKIKTVGDLDKIFTLGFRGEALASIGSVADVRIESKTEVSAASSISSGSKTISKAARGNTGTTITVSGLFRHIPARLKFLKTDNTEFNHIYDTFVNTALTQLSVHFELYNEGKLVLRLPAATEFTDRVQDIWDKNIATNLYQTTVPVYGGEAILFLGKTEIARKDRKLQYLFINNRYVTDRGIQKAISDGYSGFINRELYPVYFAKLTLDPNVVDVNVHPRKLEVRIDNAQQLFGQIRNAVADTLARSTKADMLSKIAANTELPTNQESTFTGFKPTSSSYTPKTNTYPSTKSYLPKANNEPPVRPTQFLLSDSATAATATIEDSPRNLLQLFNTYIVYQNGAEVVFIDQHAAAEKITYEKLRNQINHSRSRPLLTPLVIELESTKFKNEVIELQEELKQMGLEVSDFGGKSIQVSALPELTPHLNVASFLQELVGRNDPGVDWPALSQTGIPQTTHIRIATMACHGSIRAGQRLSAPEMQQLISDLAKCELPYNCPHGRPVSWVLSQSDLEHNFRRTL
ncbi:MAG: DNA mismatch repair endonuclease MutL [Candidatus Doudnabacteria bacterium]|nr:DNA mismatch repair endonuclease MutL [Candidatus Doudnabacteria bacterium]